MKIEDIHVEKCLFHQQGHVPSATLGEMIVLATSIIYQSYRIVLYLQKSVNQAGSRYDHEYDNCEMLPNRAEENRTRVCTSSSPRLSDSPLFPRKRLFDSKASKQLPLQSNDAADKLSRGSRFCIPQKLLFTIATSVLIKVA